MLRIVYNNELDAFRLTLETLGRTTAGVKDPQTLKGIVAKHAGKLAAIARSAIKRGYTSNWGRTFSAGTRMVYTYGKHWGAERRGRSQYPEAKPGHRSGAVANNLVQDEIIGARTMHFRVQVHPNKTYTGFTGAGDAADAGKPLWWIAAQLENPTPEVLHIPLTKRMQVYLMLVYEGKAGLNTPAPKRHLVNYRLGRNVVIQRRPLKIWERAFTDLVRKAPQLVGPGIRVDIEKVCQVSRTNAKGAKFSVRSKI